MMKMNSSVIAISVLVLAVIFSAGCSHFGGYVGHGIQTNVELSKNNFKVVGSVTGEASAGFIFGVFGPSKLNLMDQARRDMINKAKLTGASRAVANITTDTQITVYPFYNKTTVYVSGDVIEFTE